MKRTFSWKLKDMFAWNAMSAPLEQLARNAEGGRPRTPPIILLKALFVSFLFNHSDRETEFAATSNLYVKYFLGLPIDEKAPDHSTLSRFRDETLKTKGISFFRDLFRSLLSQAKERGIRISVMDALDATHTWANVDTENREIQRRRKTPTLHGAARETKPRRLLTGKRYKSPNTSSGTKAHLLVETSLGVITGYHATPGNVADIDGGDMLIHRILTNDERKDVAVLLADKGYGCPVWINLLEKYTGIMTAFSLPETMTKRGEHKEKWLAYLNDRYCFRRERYVVERANADVKDNHGMRRCRYRGLAKYAFQTAMSSMAHNLKIFVRALTGARFKPI